MADRAHWERYGTCPECGWTVVSAVFREVHAAFVKVWVCERCATRFQADAAQPSARDGGPCG